MCKKLQYLRDAQAARRKAELEAGTTRTDRRFVEKVVGDKRRKKKEKDIRRELRDE